MTELREGQVAENLSHTWEAPGELMCLLCVCVCLPVCVCVCVCAITPPLSDIVTLDLLPQRGQSALSGNNNVFSDSETLSQL